MGLAGPSVSVLKGRVAVRAKVDLVRGYDTLAVDVPVKNTVLDYNSERTVPFQLQFDLPVSFVPEVELDPLNNYGQRVHLSQVIRTLAGREYSVNLGWFIITSWEESGNVVHVTALDLLLKLEENPMAWPSSPAKNADLRREAQRLAGDLPVTFSYPGEIDMTTERSWEWGTSRSEAIRDLALARGLTYSVDTDGYLRFRPLKQGTERTRTYRCTDLLLDAPRKSRERRPNRVVAVGKGNVFDKWTTDTELDTTGESGTSGWKIATSKAAWTYRSVSGTTRARAVWALGSGASQNGFGVQLKRKFAKDPRFHMTVALTASRVMTCRYGLYRGDGAILDVKTVTIGPTRTTLSISQAAGSMADGARFLIDDGVNDGQWVEIDTVKITKTVKVNKRDSKGKLVKDKNNKNVKVDKTTTVLEQDFADHKLGGWGAIDGTTKWENTYGGSGSSHYSRLVFTKLVPGATCRPVLRFRKKSVAQGDKVISLDLRSNPAVGLRADFLRGTGAVVATSTVNSTSFETVTKTIQALTAFSGINIVPASRFGPSGRIDFRNTIIKRTYAVYKEASFVGRASLGAEPYGKDYGRVTQRVELESANSRGAAVAAANRALSDAHIANDFRSVEIIPDPTMRGGDVHGFIPEEGPPFTGRVQAFSLPVDDVTASMRVDVEVLQW